MLSDDDGLYAVDDGTEIIMLSVDDNALCC